MELVELINENIVKIPLAGNSKDDILKELITVLKDAGYIDDVEETYRDVRKREDKGSTGLENGIAIPHAKTSTVKDMTLALGIKPSGVDFESLDGKPSKVFFLLLAPPDQAGPHIEALSEIARLSRSRYFLETLSNAKNPKEAVELFKS
ncbi:MAG: PTS sugar transporter subunit IIA [Spirochaetales bacterium]|nr:PTS sugar transporter subunit IIA [Spirochaetales bacterium]RKX80354.1 MAG: PTS sugar transporter subunit IIA [Spirochaetota bacterium]